MHAYVSDVRVTQTAVKFVKTYDSNARKAVRDA
jgi:hypothetical protein